MKFLNILKKFSKSTSSLAKLKNTNVLKYKFEKKYLKFQNTLKDFTYETMLYLQTRQSENLVLFILTLISVYGGFYFRESYTKDSGSFMIPTGAMTYMYEYDNDLTDLNNDFSRKKIQFAHDYSYY